MHTGDSVHLCSINRM